MTGFTYGVPGTPVRSGCRIPTLTRTPCDCSLIPKATMRADLEIRRDEVVQAGADELLGEVVLLPLRHDPEILDVREPAFLSAQRNPKHRGRCPERVAIAALAVGPEPDRLVERPAVGQDPAPGVAEPDLGLALDRADRRVGLREESTVRHEAEFGALLA